MRKNLVKKEITAMDYLGYALYAFGGLGIEIFLMMIETSLWNVQYGQWTISQNIFHWCITCIVWGILSFVLFKHVPRESSQSKKPQWLLACVLIIFSIAYTSFVWNGFKPMLEYASNGFLKFIVQYIYYAFESFLILLIIIYGQASFEKKLNRKVSIPFGGLLLAITWGVVHVLTQGMDTGIYTCIQALIYGTIYLVFDKHIRCSYLAIAFMFML